MKTDTLQLDQFTDENLDLAYLELGNIQELEIKNVLADSYFDDRDQFLERFTGFIRDPLNLHFVAKYILNIDLLPYQLVVLNQLWHKPFPMLIATRGGAKSYLLAVYAVLRAVIDQGVKIVVVGAALRQSLVIYNYVQSIWENAPVLQDICGGKKYAPKRDLHMCLWKCGSSEMKFLPLGNGDTIRGQRANVVIGDEFSSIPPDVFEVVVRGFAAVKSQGLVENVSNAFRKIAMKKMGLHDTEKLLQQSERIQTKSNLGCNQIVIAGTSSFQFNHFYKYFRYYKAIIESCGDLGYLKQNYPDMTIPANIDSSQYCIIRLPYDLIPPGMMDEAILAQGRATMNSILFDQEYGCVFPSDSDGFFPASVLHACTCPLNAVGGVIDFAAGLFNNMSSPCVMGIDPASENDNFAINIIESIGGRRHIVYQWSTNRKKYQDQKEKGLVDASINDYNTFTIRHIRSLLKRFRIDLIVCDAGGGGLTIKEGLRDLDKLIDGERPIYDMDDETAQGNDGDYIFKLVHFQDADWRKQSHYGLKTDFSNKRVLFPQFNTLSVAEDAYRLNPGEYETVEDVYLEIEELKHEIMLIKHDTTITGQERWDVPKLRVSGADEIKKLLKKDRFTSLLLSNWGARFIEDQQNNNTNYQGIGRNINDNKLFVPGTNHVTYIGQGAKKLKTITNIDLGFCRRGVGRK